MVSDSASNNKKLEWLRSVADYLPVPPHHLAQFSDELINKTLRENNLPPLYSDVSEIPSDSFYRASWARDYYNALDNGDIPSPSQSSVTDKVHKSDWEDLISDSGNKVNNPLPPREGGDGAGSIVRPDPDPVSPLPDDRPSPDIVGDIGRDEIYRDDADGDGVINGNDDDFNASYGGIFGPDGIFGSNFVSSFTKLFQSLISKYTDATVTGGEEIRNQWDLDKINLANEFSAQQAEISRDWQQQMYEQYNSLSGKIHQAEQAGVNPMFAVTGNAVSPMSTSTGSPSGAVASGSGQKSGSDLLSSIASLISLKSQIKKTNAETEAIQTQTDISLQKLSYELNNMQSSTDLNIQKVVESATSVEKMKADIGLTNEQAEVAVQQVQYLVAQANYINAIKEPEMRLKRAQATIAEWQDKNKKLFKGLDIGMDAANTIVDLGVGIFNAKTGRIFANK